MTDPATNTTSTDAGLSQIPTATSDPSVVINTATGGYDDGQTATGGDTPTQDTATDHAGFTAEQAFDALMLDDDADPSQSTPSEQTTDAADASTTDQATDGDDQEANTDAGEPPTPETPTKSKADAKDEDIDITAQERDLKAVPLKKLERALASRKEARERAATYERDLTTTKQELEQERGLTDKVLDTFESAGLTDQKLVQFLGDLKRVRQDPSAAERIAATIGLSAQPATSAIDVEALQAAFESYDADAFQRLVAPLKAAKTAAATPAPAAQRAEPAPQQPAQTAPAKPFAQVTNTVTKVGDTLKAVFGKDEGNRLLAQVSADAKQRLAEMERNRAVINEDTVIAVFEGSRDRVLAMRNQRPPETAKSPAGQQPARRSPPTHLPPARVASPRKLTAEQEFEKL